jgi:NitT/TauT family transport system substrate-binding protein
MRTTSRHSPGAACNQPTRPDSAPTDPRQRPRCRIQRVLLAALLGTALVGCGAPAPSSAPAAPAQQPAAPAAPVASGAAPTASGAAPAAAPAATAPPAPVAIKIVNPATSVSWLPAKMAEALGYFREEGIEVSFPRANATVAMAGLAAHEIDFATDTGSVIRAAAVQDLPVTVLVVFTERPGHTLNVRPEIRAIGDLRDKAIAIPQGQAIGTTLTRRLLVGVGLQPDRDVNLVALGDDAARWAALEQNIVQGSMFPPPINVKAENGGFPILVKSADYVPSFIVGLGAHKSYLTERPDVLRRVLRASVRGLRAVHEDRAASTQVMQDWVELTPAEAARGYDLVLDTYSKNGILTDPMLQENVAMLREDGSFPDDRPAVLTQVSDMAPLRAVLRELNVPE